jgi:hypothetical protein
MKTLAQLEERFVKAAKIKVGTKLVRQRNYSRFGNNESFFDPEIRTVKSVGKAFVMLDNGDKIKIENWYGPSSPAEIKKAEERIQFLKDWSSANEDNMAFDLVQRRKKFSLAGAVTLNLQVAGLAIKPDDEELTLEDLPPEIARDVSDLGFERKDHVRNTLRINGEKFFLKSYGGQTHTFERAKA